MQDYTGIEDGREGRNAKLQRAIYATTTKQHETEEPDYCLLLGHTRSVGSNPTPG
jgi:hypothetical protein